VGPDRIIAAHWCFHSPTPAPAARQAVTAAQAHCDLSRVEAVAAEVRALEQQLKQADRDAAQYNTRWAAVC
jgi:hypothetical protein